MNDVSAIPAPDEAADEESNAKEAIYVMIGDFVKAKTEKRIGKTGGREIFDMVVEHVFAAAARDSTFRFNGGFGSLHVKKYQAGSRRLPSGQTTTFGERQKVRYEEGVVVKALISSNGDLGVALKARGSRAKTEVPAPAAKEVKAKPAKTEVPAPAAKEAAKPAKEAAKPAGDDLDLD